MTPDQAAWVRAHVIDSYHEANERHPECEPGYAPDEPVPARVHFCDRRMGVLVGPGRLWPNHSRGFPYRYHPVWLAHARDRYARHPENDPGMEQVPAAPEQLDLFPGVTA